MFYSSLHKYFQTQVRSCLNFWDEAWWFLSLRVFIFIVISRTFWLICPPAFFRCLSMNFLDEAWWFLSLRVFIFIVISRMFRPICPPAFFRFLSINFWDEAWWFLSLKVFELLSSSLLLFPQHFGRYILQLSSGVCQTREPSWNFKLLQNNW